MAMLGLKDTQAGVFAGHLASFTGVDPRPSWLHEIRKSAFEHFVELGFPTHRHEGWRQTNLSPIATSVFQRQPAWSPAEFVPRLRGLELPGIDWSADAPRLVFVNGEYAPGLSNANAQVRPMGPLLSDAYAPLVRHLEAETDYRNQAFVAFNLAFLAEGAYVEVPKGTVLERPLAILHVSTGTAERKGITHPRTIVHVGREAQVSVVETFAGFPGDVYFTNSVTEFVIGENAAVEYTRLEQESGAASHVSKLYSRQDRSSRFTAHSVALGGGLVRNNVHAILDGEGAECTLNGLYAIGGTQHVDNSTILDHAKPLCTSREYYKGVLDGKAAGVFNGRIIVRKDAQHTDAIQSNKNLLLSDSAATVNAQPQLEIYADDVRCTHGATVGQLDAQALFYLRSRALGLEESRRLLIYAFAADVLDRIRDQGLRERVEAMLFLRWNG